MRATFTVDTTKFSDLLSSLLNADEAIQVLEGTNVSDAVIENFKELADAAEIFVSHLAEQDNNLGGMFEEYLDERRVESVLQAA